MTSTTDRGLPPAESPSVSSHKPGRAGRTSVGMGRDEPPEPRRLTVERVVELARAGGDR